MELTDLKKKGPITNYKYRDLKVYASTEWLAEGKKKYRRVFEKQEVGYLYVELSCFNKLFDEAHWDTKIRLVCHRFMDEGGKEELCSINVEKHITDDENIFFVREGWGHSKAGQYWKRGSYIWEAYIAEEIPVPQETPHADDGTEEEGETTLDYRLVGSTTFYIEDGGVVTDEDNPYFDIDQIKLYEGASQGVQPTERTYLSQFHASETRYVWAEITLDNMMERAWYGELFFSFYNSEGQLKGMTTELRTISDKDDQVTLVTGWGSDTKGTWFNDRYTLEVSFHG